MKKILLVILCVVLLFSVTSCKNTPEDTSIPNRYVDIPEVERAATGLTWPEGQALPSMAYPVDNMDAIQIASKNENEKSMLASLAGIVNRTQPRIYLYNDTDATEKWADNMGLTYTLTKDEEAIIEKYKDEIKGLVVWDTKERHTLNLATTYAGIYDCMVVTAKQAEKYSAAPYNFEIRENYVGKFKDKYEVYEYMYDNLWEHCTKRIVMGLAPYAGGHTCHSRDLAVAAKCAVIWLDLIEAVKDDKGNVTAENPIQKDYDLLEKFLKDCTPGESYWVGWWHSEGKGVELSSRYGMPTVPADFFENYTVYAGCSRELDIPTVPAKPELEAKIYIAFTISDGDNMQYCQHHMKSNGNMWSHKKRGTVPITWTFSPVLYDAAPQMLNWYYKESGDNDFLIAGPSGVGYTNPVLWEEAMGNNDAYLKYIKVSDSYFRRTAFNFTTVWHQVNNGQAKLIADNWGSLLGYSTQSTMANQEAYSVIGNGVIKIQTEPSYDGNIPRVKDILKDICEFSFSRVPVFVMPQIIAWEAGVKEINEIAKELKEEYGDRVDFVRVDQLCMLYSEYKGGLYNVSLQNQNVTASGYDSEDVLPVKVTKKKQLKITGVIFHQHFEQFHSAADNLFFHYLYFQKHILIKGSFHNSNCLAPVLIPVGKAVQHIFHSPYIQFF